MRLKNFFWLTLCLMLLMGVGFLSALRSYQVFTSEELVAILKCQPPPPESSYRFTVEYTPIRNGTPGVSMKFPMYGEQWSIGGSILKWHPWLNLMGFKSCHKLTRLSSRYVTSVRQTSQPQVVYDLNGGDDWLWQRLTRWGRWIPFVEAVYGNSVYYPAQPGSRWGIYVTLSGYLTKPLSSSRGSEKS